VIGDTIQAVASPPGAARRGIVRVSGPSAFAAVEGVLSQPLPRVRGASQASAQVLGHGVDCLVLAMPGPRSYTGEDVVELHQPGSPIQLELVCEGLSPHARLATPGEFTRRAFEHGRLDLAEAEAVLALIHAADVEEGRFALDVLRGGLSAAVDGIRREVQDALAALEAGLDFTDGETGEVDRAAWSPRLLEAHRLCAELIDGLPETSVAGEVLLHGMANAGKSSLANALLGTKAALVADQPGTTRDVLVFELEGGIRLLDAPGELEEEPAAGADCAALAMRDRIARRVAGVVSVVDVTTPRPVHSALPMVAQVFTKCDLLAAGPVRAVMEACAPSRPAGVPVFASSAVSGEGIAALREGLRRRVGGGPRGMTSRLHAALGQARDSLGAAIQAADEGALEELVAVDLSVALGKLDSIHGRSSPEDLLDRIFGAFCLGK